MLGGVHCDDIFLPLNHLAEAEVGLLGEVNIWATRIRIRQALPFFQETFRGLQDMLLSV